MTSKHYRCQILVPFLALSVVRYISLVLLVAPRQADLHVLCQVGGNRALELVNVLSVDLLGESKGSVDDLGVEVEEALSNLVGTGVLIVQSCDEDGLFTVVVELEVDGALRENSALELLQTTGDLRVVLARYEAVLEDVAELDVLAVDNGQKLGSARVNVRSVDSAWLQEAEGGGDAQTGKDWEAIDVLCTYQ